VANPTAVDDAVLGVLKADATLQTLLPHGVHFAAAMPGSTRYVLVEAEASEPTYGFGMTLYERYVYVIQAIAIATDEALVGPAADRIHALLQDVPLTIAGYSWMATQQVQRVRLTDPDSIDTGNLRFQTRGGSY